MAESNTRETCSLTHCPSPAVQSEYGEVGPWLVTIFYCDEHARELNAGTPLGAVGVDTAHVRIEPVDGSEPPPSSGRLPGIA